MNQSTVPPRSFHILLGVMCCLFFLSPVTREMGLGSFFFKGAFFALSISCIYLVSRKKIQTLIAILLVIPGILMTFSTDSFEYTTMEIGGLVSNLILYSFVIYVIWGYLRGRRKVDGNIISGAICIYLLLGLVWSFVYMIIELLTPNSFNGIYDSDMLKIHSLSDAFYHLFYYSYVTLTTLGYGSISPRSVVASSFASAEAIVGQLYIAVFIARLVGLYTAQELRGDVDGVRN